MRSPGYPRGQYLLISLTAAMSANADGAPSGVRTAEPSPGAVLHLVDPSTLCADGPSTGAASASADTAALPSDFSAANFPTGTDFVSAGAEATHQELLLSTSRKFCIVANRLEI